MQLSRSTRLTEQEQRLLEERGYHYPISVMDSTEVERYRQRFQEYWTQGQEQLKSMTGNKRYQLFSQMHFVAGWVYEMVSQTRVLDAVESVLGPNLLVWDTGWFAKMPGEKTFVSWHQDGMYWRLSPDKIVTAWVALSPSRRDNGCLRVIPGTHKQPALPHLETHHPDNALSRGQDVAAEVDESQAVDLELEPGEMSLHQLWIVHGSRANMSPDTPRIGLAIRYVSPEVRQESPARPLAILVRGRDDYGHFELLPPPKREQLLPGDPEHVAIVDRLRKSILK